jgi:hypothetical protein
MMNAIAPLKEEPKLDLLDAKSDATYVLLTPFSPYIVLWVGKKWPQVRSSLFSFHLLQTTGYFFSDIQCSDLSVLYGPRTDSASIRLMLDNLEKGRPGHKLVSLSPYFLLDHLRSLYIVVMVLHTSPLCMVSQSFCHQQLPLHINHRFLSLKLYQSVIFLPPPGRRS